MRQTPQPTDKRVRIDLLYADEAVADKQQRPDVQVIRGNVRLLHDSMYMYCDSALIYEKTDSVEAFGNVRMEQGDTLFLYGDYMCYGSATQIAELHDNVRLINRNTQLETENLNYDRMMNVGYYYDGGTLTDEENVLTSDEGEYSPATKLAVFTQNVELVNPQFTLSTDELHYNTDTKIASIVSLSEIVNEQSRIISTDGMYNTVTGIAQLYERSTVFNEGRALTGDTLFYDREAGIGEAFGHVVMNDTVNKNMLTGEYCFYDQFQENAFATDRAVAIDYSQGDSLYMHADTLRLISRNLNTDSLIRELHAYHKVRVFRSDVQAICDSLVFNSVDSCLTMYRDPILWQGEDQLLGEMVKVYMNDSTIEWAHIINQALTVERHDSIHYNQVAGREMKAFFDNGDIRQVDINGNVLVVYYPIDEKDSTIMFMNYTEGSYLKMFIKERKMDKGIFIGKTTGTTYPLDQVPEGKDRLETFAWFGDLRPRNKDDIFEWRGKAQDQTLRKIERDSDQSPRSIRTNRRNNR